MKKRLITIVSALVLVLALGALAACGGNDTTDTPAASPSPSPEQQTTASPSPTPEQQEATADEVELVLAWWGNPLRNEQTTEAVGLFTANYPHISFEEQTVGWGDYWALLSTMAVGGDLPDVIQMDWAFLEQYVANGLLVDLRPFIDSGVIDLSDVPENVIETGRVGDGIYAISIGMNGASMIYNASILAELGIEMNHNTTLDEFIEIARTVYAETGVRTNFVYTDPSNPLEVLLRARGITMLTPGGMGGTVEDYLEFFQLLEDGITEGWHIHPADMVGRQGTEQDPLIYGDTPQQTSWMGLYFSNMLAGFLAVAPEGMELGMTTYPSVNPQVSNFIRASMYFSITSQSDHPQEAAQFINFWTNSVDVNRVILAERGIPASAVVADAVSGDLNEANQIAQAFVDFVADNSTPVNPPRPEGAAEIVAELRVLTEAVGHGQMTAQQAAEAFFSFGNSILN